MEPSVSTTPVWDADLETMRKYLRTALNLNLSRNVALFRAWDRDRNAVVNRNDFRRALLTLSYPGGQADIDALYSSISTAADKDKEIYSVLQRAADSSMPVPRYHHEIGSSEIDDSGHQSVPNSYSLEALSRLTGHRAGPGPPGHSPRRYCKPEEAPPLPTPPPLEFGHTPLPTRLPVTLTTKPAAWHPAERVSPSAPKPHFTEDASFLGWTLDDLPSVTRTIFNSARCLDPQSLIHSPSPSPSPSPSTLALALTFALALALALASPSPSPSPSTSLSSSPSPSPSPLPSPSLSPSQPLTPTLPSHP